MMMKSVAALLLLLGGSNHLICFGFTLFNPSNPSFLSTRIRSSSSLSAGSYGDKDRDAIMARNNARTCVKSFLTQRAIQSFMFLLEECRDPHSGKWIQEFLGLQNLLEYHGTGAFDIDRFPQWEAVLLDMMEKPKDTIIVSAKRRGRGHGGWSKDNPYLEERWVEFPIDIDPASLAQRILSVRGQIANEFVQDLDIIISTNDQILDSYFDTIRNEERTTAGTGVDSTVKSPQDLANAFDRTTSYILSNNMESSVIASSPFRKGNFDLLYNLCTQASIHELLRDYLQEAGHAKEASLMWLRNFYIDRAGEYFDGDQPYGRADDFIEEMLLTPPAVKDLGVNAKGEAVVDLIDPLAMAEKIIARRTKIAQEWKKVMGQTAADHMQLQKVLLAKIMGKPVEDFKRDILARRNSEESTGQSTFE